MSDDSASPRTLHAAAAMSVALLLVYCGWALGLPSWCVSTALLVYLTLLLAYVCAPGTWAGHGPWTKLVLLLLLTISLGTVTTAWDARSIWLFHGKRIYLDGDLYAQLDGYFGLSHNDYPVLLPALAASIAQLLGGWNEIAPKLAGMLIWVPALLVILELLPTVAARLLFLVAILMVDGSGLVDGMVDMPLALLVTACAAAMQRLLHLSDPVVAAAADGAAPRISPTLLLLPPLLLALMSLTKNEGLVLAGLLFSGFALLAVARRSAKALRLTLALGIVAFVWAIAWEFARRDSGIVVDLGPGAWSRLRDRLPVLENHALIIGALFGAKPLLISLLVATLGLVGSSRQARAFALPLGVAALYLVVLHGVYLSTPNDLAWHLGSSASRILNSVELLLLYVGLAAWFGANPVTRE